LQSVINLIIYITIRKWNKNFGCNLRLLATITDYWCNVDEEEKFSVPTASETFNWMIYFDQIEAVNEAPIRPAKKKYEYFRSGHTHRTTIINKFAPDRICSNSKLKKKEKNRWSRIKNVCKLRKGLTNFPVGMSRLNFFYARSLLASKWWNHSHLIF
jgi:hypothetical protein